MRRRAGKREKSVTRHDLLAHRKLELALPCRGLGVGWGGMDVMGAPHLTSRTFFNVFSEEAFYELALPS